jgi:hypothetical protein
MGQTGRLRKQLFREIRKELGWFPLWPVCASLELGAIGHFYSRSQNFEWVTSLAELAIALDPIASPATVDELYTTQSAVSYQFHGEESLVRADFSFTRQNAIVTQGYEMRFQRLPLKQLEDLLVDQIQNQKLEWNFNWVIVTEIFQATGFSLLMSGSRRSSVSFAAQIPNGLPYFNIANINLGLETTQSSQMSFSSVCRQNVTPYFYVHKLLYNDGRLCLERYAQQQPKAYTDYTQLSGLV